MPDCWAFGTSWISRRCALSRDAWIAGWARHRQDGEVSLVLSRRTLPVRVPVRGVRPTDRPPRRPTPASTCPTSPNSAAGRGVRDEPAVVARHQRPWRVVQSRHWPPVVRARQASAGARFGGVEVGLGLGKAVGRLRREAAVRLDVDGQRTTIAARRSRRNRESGGTLRPQQHSTSKSQPASPRAEASRRPARHPRIGPAGSMFHVKRTVNRVYRPAPGRGPTRTALGTSPTSRRSPLLGRHDGMDASVIPALDIPHHALPGPSHPRAGYAAPSPPGLNPRSTAPSSSVRALPGSGLLLRPLGSEPCPGPVWCFGLSGLSLVRVRSSASPPPA
jgi:hypothetical protein